MWDLIESVPDHCLSFYFLNRFYARATRALGSVVVHTHTSHSVRMKDF